MVVSVRRRSRVVARPARPMRSSVPSVTLERPPRFVCGGDAHLVNLSFYDADHLAPAADLVLAHGLVDVEKNRVVDVTARPRP